jgi:hypothetical protein
VWQVQFPLPAKQLTLRLLFEKQIVFSDNQIMSEGKCYAYIYMFLCRFTYGPLSKNQSAVQV